MTEFDILLRYYLRRFKAGPIIGIASCTALLTAILPAFGIVMIPSSGLISMAPVAAMLIYYPLVAVYAWNPHPAAESGESYLMSVGGSAGVMRSRFAASLIVNLVVSASLVTTGILAFGFEYAGHLPAFVSTIVLFMNALFLIVAISDGLFSRRIRAQVTAGVTGLTAASIVLLALPSPAPLLGLASAALASVCIYLGLKVSRSQAVPGEISSIAGRVDRIASEVPRVSIVVAPRALSRETPGRRVGCIRRALWTVFRCGEGQFFGSGLALLGISSINLAVNQSAATLQIYIIGVYLVANVWAPISVAMRRIGADLRARRDAFHVLAALVLASLIPAFLVVSFIGAKTSTLKIHVDFEDGDDEVEETASPLLISAVCFFSENSLCLELGDGGTNVSTWREHYDARNACRKARQELLEARVADLKHGRPNGGAFQREVECLKPGRTVGASLDPSDDYFRRQLATFFWNTYGLSDLDVVAIDEDEDKVWKITCGVEAHVRKSAVHLRIVELAAFATGAFLLLAAVFPPWWRAQRWLTRFRWIRNVAVAAVFLGISAFVFFGLTRELVDRLQPGHILDDRLELVRSSWGGVLYVAQTYWWLWVALCAVACVFLYRAALRGFLMADMASGMSLQAIFRRKREGGHG
jgi:hypothetical protein